MKRAKEIHHLYHNGNAVADARKAHPKVNFRYVIGQEDRANGLEMLQFDGAKTLHLQEKGRKQAFNALNISDGKSYQYHYELN